MHPSHAGGVDAERMKVRAQRRGLMWRSQVATVAMWSEVEAEFMRRPLRSLSEVKVALARTRPWVACW